LIENKVVKVLYQQRRYHVLAVNVSVGDYVKAGQKLATIKVQILPATSPIYR
jgi:murein DD-endopeptidase MepM/ murein hydrolase activator NlpD